MNKVTRVSAFRLPAVIIGIRRRFVLVKTMSTKQVRVTGIDLRMLRCFAKIVDRGGFSGARTGFAFSQPFLSDQMTALETRLGIALCQRGHDGLKLMPDGERVYKAAKQLISVVDAFKADIREIEIDIGEFVVASTTRAPRIRAAACRRRSSRWFFVKEESIKKIRR